MKPLCEVQSIETSVVIRSFASRPFSHMSLVRSCQQPVTAGQRDEESLTEQRCELRSPWLPES